MADSDPSSWARALGAGEPPSHEGFSALEPGVRAAVTSPSWLPVALQYLERDIR